MEGKLNMYRVLIRKAVSRFIACIMQLDMMQP